MKITRTFDLNGTIETTEDMSEEELYDEFLEWCEEKGFKFGGSVNETTEEPFPLEDEEDEDEDGLDLYEE